MKKYLIPSIMSVILFLLAGYHALLQIACVDPVSYIHACVSIDGTAERINLWKNEDENVFLFLPTCVKKDDVDLQISPFCSVHIGGSKIWSGMSLSDYAIGTKYSIKIDYLWRHERYVFTILQSENVGTIFITTEYDGMRRVEAERDYKAKGEIGVFTCEGQIDYHGRLQSIEGRGNSTRWAEKKPYNIRFPDKVSLLGMDSGREWVLLANSFDSTQIRNKVVLDFAARIGLEYTPKAEYAELWCNGEYRGLYLLTQHIDEDLLPVEGQGGLICSLEMIDRLAANGQRYVRLDSGQGIRLRYTGNTVGNDDETIRGTLQAVEDAILASDSTDSEENRLWTRYIDADSWGKKYLLEEIFLDRDACYASEFFYRKPGQSLLFAGPAWDYDLAFDNDGVSDAQSMLANRMWAASGIMTPWYGTLYRNDTFRNAVILLYDNEIRSFMMELADSEIVKAAIEIESAIRTDSVRYQISLDAFKEDILQMIRFIRARIDFLDSLWIKNEEYCVITADGGTMYYYFYVKKGEALAKDMPMPEEYEGKEFLGWYLEGTKEAFSKDRPVVEDIRLEPHYVGN